MAYAVATGQGVIAASVGVLVFDWPGEAICVRAAARLLGRLLVEPAVPVADKMTLSCAEVVAACPYGSARA
ncbi:MAG: hypothetical protein ACP5VR_10865 [Acidimicrobiales bacterium]